MLCLSTLLVCKTGICGHGPANTKTLSETLPNIDCSMAKSPHNNVESRFSVAAEPPGRITSLDILGPRPDNLLAALYQQGRMNQSGRTWIYENVRTTV